MAFHCLVVAFAIKVLQYISLGESDRCVNALSHNKLATRTALIRRVAELDNANSNDWTTYEDQLEEYLKANSITDDENKRSLFLTTCGKKTYRLLREIVTPAKAAEVTYNEIRKIFQEHFTPPPSRIVESNRFYNRRQERGGGGRGRCQTT